MIELVIVFFLARKMGRIAEEKGRSVWGYRLMAAGLWFGGEIAGAIVGVMIANGAEGTIYFFALLGAVAGALTAYIIARNVSSLYSPFYNEYPQYGPPPYVPPQYAQQQWPGAHGQHGAQNYPAQGNDAHAPQNYPAQNNYAPRENNMHAAPANYAPQQPPQGNDASQPAQSPELNQAPPTVMPADDAADMFKVAEMTSAKNFYAEPEQYQQAEPFVQPAPVSMAEQTAQAEARIEQGMMKENRGKVCLACQQCGNEFWLSAQWGGLFCRCPKCGRPVGIPAKK